jgi:hypothetical protein
MTYAVRVRLYNARLTGPATEPLADTDPDLRDGAPGCEIAETLEGVGQVLRDLCAAFYGPAVQLLGLSDMALGAYLAAMREHISKASALSYNQSYIVKSGGVVDWWYACVDVHRSVAP